MSDPRERPDPRKQPSSGRDDDPNLGQKEAEREKAELEEEDEDDQDDELEPMMDKAERQRPSTD